MDVEGGGREGGGGGVGGVWLVLNATYGLLEVGKVSKCVCVCVVCVRACVCIYMFAHVCERMCASACARVYSCGGMG